MKKRGRDRLRDGSRLKPRLTSDSDDCIECDSGHWAKECGVTGSWER